MNKLMLLLCFFYWAGCKNQVLKKEEFVSQSWAFPAFEKTDSLNPILKPSTDLSFLDPISKKSTYWEERNVLNPSAVIKDDKVFLLYRAQDKSGTSRIGLAVSNDGLHFTKHPSPVLYPDHDSMKIYEWNYKKAISNKSTAEILFDGAEDPRIVQNDSGVYIMTYTAYDGKTARLCLASSQDLFHWTKHGLAFNTEKYKNTWSKSGAIVSELRGTKMIAKKIGGRYWMYWGDTNLFIATSDDLIHWSPAVNDESGNLISVLNPRPGYFDSRLVEPGPYAMVKKDGILLIYNGSNAANFNDTGLPKFTYAAGQVLFDQSMPFKMIDRTDHYFIYPDKEYEKLGEVNEVCFVEGLVYFHDAWFLYYGTGDSKIAVARNGL